MGVTVPAGVTSISAPPMRNSSSIGNPPVLQFHQNPLLFQQPQQMALLPTNKPQMVTNVLMWKIEINSYFYLLDAYIKISSAYFI